MIDEDQKTTAAKGIQAESMALFHNDLLIVCDLHTLFKQGPDAEFLQQ